jgi:hypothetical protein
MGWNGMQELDFVHNGIRWQRHGHGYEELFFKDQYSGLSSFFFVSCAGETFRLLGWRKPRSSKIRAGRTDRTDRCRVAR